MTNSTSIYKVLLLQRNPSGERTAIATARDVLIPALSTNSPARVVVSWSAEQRPRTVVPLQTTPLRMLSVWLPEPPAVRDLAAVLEPVDPGVEVFAVQASEPIPPRLPAADAGSPAVVLLTLLRRARGLDDATFLHEWHDRHTPLAMRVHPLQGYVRNVIDPATAHSPDPPDGIVEEQYADARTIARPWRMFGHNGAWRSAANMWRVWRHVRTFLDLDRAENWLMHQVEVELA
ncbi:MAG: hypothetical protein D6761_07255 [Candidatus Dadabacteria bacterium]|nr:MAG: hypothetical protein D6761_07255 [Candidatus Dadabacteria bacterium]